MLLLPMMMIMMKIMMGITKKMLDSGARFSQMPKEMKEQKGEQTEKPTRMGVKDLMVEKKIMEARFKPEQMMMHKEQIKMMTEHTLTLALPLWDQLHYMLNMRQILLQSMRF